MAKIKESMGNTFDEETLKSPLTVGRVGNEPGPDVNNIPVARAEGSPRPDPRRRRYAELGRQEVSEERDQQWQQEIQPWRR